MARCDPRLQRQLDQVLPRLFFARPAEVVAPELIGCRLVRRQADGTLLWGKSGDTAVNIAPLSTQATPVAVVLWRDHIATLVLRALAGALAGLLFAVYRHT